MTFNLRLIPLLPFLGAPRADAVRPQVEARHGVRRRRAGAIGAACLVALDAFFSALPGARRGGLRDVVATWIAAGALKVDLAFRMDALSGVMCLIITFIGFLIHVYSTGYMAHDPDYARFFAYLNLFCGAMLVLVLGRQPAGDVRRLGGRRPVQLPADRLLVQRDGQRRRRQEGVHHQPHRRLRLPDRDVPAVPVHGLAVDPRDHRRAATPGGRADGAMLWLGQPVAFWAALFLFVGATGKSAQMPLYVWLPDAMAGPTPVSALIHAATMVTAGVYMVARLHAVYLLSPAAMAIVAVVGALTALFAAIIGFAQNDFKKVLAYSTVSQLGFMFVGVGTGELRRRRLPPLHARLLQGRPVPLRRLGHARHERLGRHHRRWAACARSCPWTHGVFFVCWLAICGFPSSRASSRRTRSSPARSRPRSTDAGWPGWADRRRDADAAALGTAFYMSRLYFLVFSGDESRASDESPAPHPRVAGDDGGAAGGAGDRRDAGRLHRPPRRPLRSPRLEPPRRTSWRRSSGQELEVPHTIEIGFMVGATLLALVGIGLACGLLRRRLQRAGARSSRARSPASSSWCRTSSASTSCTTR